jgi:hypothetical protein
MKTFKEKKAFYKERQELYDLAKRAKDENLRQVSIQGNAFDVSDRENANHVLLYC